MIPSIGLPNTTWQEMWGEKRREAICLWPRLCGEWFPAILIVQPINCTISDAHPPTLLITLPLGYNWGESFPDTDNSAVQMPYCPMRTKTPDNLKKKCLTFFYKFEKYTFEKNTHDLY